MDWKTLGESVIKLGLPLLGAVLPIPGGAAIGTALAAAIGSGSADPADILNTLTANADALAKAKQFEETHQETMLKLQLDHELGMYQEEVADRASARTMQTDTKSGILPMLAIVIVGAFVAMVAGTLLGYSHVEGALAGTLVGYLSAKCEQVLAFYFGSSASSRAKDQMLFNSMPANQAPTPPAV